MSKSFELGDAPRVKAVFTDLDTNSAVDPDAVNVAFLPPGGSLTTYAYGTDAALVKDSTGNYHAILNANTAGIWYFRWYSTGSGQSADESSFKVRDATATS